MGGSYYFKLFKTSIKEDGTILKGKKLATDKIYGGYSAAINNFLQRKVDENVLFERFFQSSSLVPSLKITSAGMKGLLKRAEERSVLGVNTAILIRKNKTVWWIDKKEGKYVIGAAYSEQQSRF